MGNEKIKRTREEIDSLIIDFIKIRDPNYVQRRRLHQLLPQLIELQIFNEQLEVTGLPPTAVDLSSRISGKIRAILPEIGDEATQISTMYFLSRTGLYHFYEKTIIVEDQQIALPLVQAEIYEAIQETPRPLRRLPTFSRRLTDIAHQYAERNPTNYILYKTLYELRQIFPGFELTTRRQEFEPPDMYISGKIGSQTCALDLLRGVLYVGGNAIDLWRLEKITLIELLRGNGSVAKKELHEKLKFKTNQNNRLTSVRTKLRKRVGLKLRASKTHLFAEDLTFQSETENYSADFTIDQHRAHLDLENEETIIDDTKIKLSQIEQALLYFFLFNFNAGRRTLTTTQLLHVLAPHQSKSPNNLTTALGKLKKKLKQADIKLTIRYSNTNCYFELITDENTLSAE